MTKKSLSWIVLKGIFRINRLLIKVKEQTEIFSKSFLTNYWFIKMKTTIEIIKNNYKFLVDLDRKEDVHFVWTFSERSPARKYIHDWTMRFHYQSEINRTILSFNVFILFISGALHFLKSAIFLFKL